LLVVAADGTEHDLEALSVSLGFVAEPEIIGSPAWLYTADAGIDTPELRWPTTPATFASTNFWAIVGPIFGSAWSSSLIISNLTVLPPIFIFFAVASSTAR
jgi:hypothetical protein